MRLALLLLSVLAACHLGASLTDNEIAQRALDWVKKNVNCDTNNACNVDVNYTGRKKRDADDDVTTAAGDDEAATESGEMKTDFLNDACSGLGLASSSTFNLKLISEMFRGFDKLGKADDILEGTEPRKFVKALELLESCLQKESE
ncbi:uncharacterized protein [Littorina saxatilis]|uniref:Uncharacterized protein n=1 Tax=Littorina saxatilis TaxID=31220 RepID=A0AAN9GD48_9CAEN